MTDENTTDATEPDPEVPEAPPIPRDLVEEKFDQRVAWAKAWTAALGKMPEIEATEEAVIPGKEGKQGFRYSYANLTEILGKVRPILTEHGLALSQVVEPHSDGVGVTTVIHHEGGHHEAYGPLVIPARADARAIGSAITYARRYAIVATLSIATGEGDDDGEAAVKTEPTSRERPAMPPSDPHEAAWAKALELFGDKAEKPFLAALKVAGVQRGKADETQATTVIDWLTDEHARINEDGSGY